jgi:hypothetical protein
MVVHIQVGKAVVHRVGKLVGKAVGMVVRMASHMEDMVHMLEDTPVCKVLHKQDCRLEDIWVCKVHKLEGMVHNNRQNNGWNSLSTRVPRHPKKATRLIFPVVFSLKDSLCLGLVYVRVFRKISQNLCRLYSNKLLQSFR